MPEEEEEEGETEEDPACPALKQGKLQRWGRLQRSRQPSVVDFNGDMSTLHEHEAVINAQARDWLEEAAQETRDAMPKWRQVDTSESPLCGLHALSQ